MYTWKNYYFCFHLSHVHKLGQKHDTFEIKCTKIKSLAQPLMVHSNNIQYCDLYHIDLRRLSNNFLSFQTPFYGAENKMCQRKLCMMLWLLLPYEVDIICSIHSIPSHGYRCFVRVRDALCYAFITLPINSLPLSKRAITLRVSSVWCMTSRIGIVNQFSQ